MLRSDWRLVGAASDLQTRHAQTTAIIKQSSVCFGGLIKWTITSLRAREVIRRSFLYLFFFFSSQKTINCNVVLFSQNYSEQLFEETTELFCEYETKQRYNIETNNLILCSWNSLDLSEYDHETSGCPAVSGTETFVCGCWGELRIRLVPARYLGNLSCCCSWAAVVTCQGEVSSWTSPVSGFNVGLIGVFKGLLQWPVGLELRPADRKWDNEQVVGLSPWDEHETTYYSTRSTFSVRTCLRGVDEFNM